MVYEPIAEHQQERSSRSLDTILFPEYALLPEMIFLAMDSRVHLRGHRLMLPRSEQSARHRNTRVIPLALILVGCCLLNTANSQTQIHKCTDENGGVAYSQLPCAPQKTKGSEKTVPDVETERAIPASEEKQLSTNETPTEKSELATASLACKKRYRDAIDAIDAEISRQYSPDKAEEYKQRLLQLTRKLRQC